MVLFSFGKFLFGRKLFKLFSTFIDVTRIYALMIVTVFNIKTRQKEISDLDLVYNDFEYCHNNRIYRTLPH